MAGTVLFILLLMVTVLVIYMFTKIQIMQILLVGVLSIQWLKEHVDTTRHAEIIASREDDPNNKVIVVFEKKSSLTINTYDLFDATRDNNVWTPYNTWVIPD